VIVALVIYNLTGGVGITLAYHRMLTHKGLMLWRPFEYASAILGALALQGGPIEWVSTHRKHHAFSDQENDPHSMRRGFLWAHMAWLFRPNPQMLTSEEVGHYAPDLLANPFYRWLDTNTLWLQVALGMLLLAFGGWSWLIWGVFVRLVVCYHVTWLINSASHMSGYRSFHTGDLSTNCWWLALLSWGEGWHNNHHAFPFSARHGLRWFEIDFTWLLIRALRLLHLAREIKIPTRQMQIQMRERLRAAAAGAARLRTQGQP
jgi:stearoyl-CoA desaturase (delta-9 desaturase)